MADLRPFRVLSGFDFMPEDSNEAPELHSENVEEIEDKNDEEWEEMSDEDKLESLEGI